MNEYRCPSREDWVKLANIFSLEYESCSINENKDYKKLMHKFSEDSPAIDIHMPFNLYLLYFYFKCYPKEQKETTCYGDCNVQAVLEKFHEYIELYSEREVSIFKKIYSDSQQTIESLDIVDASADEDDGDDDELDADDDLVDLDTGDLVDTAVQQSDKPSIHNQSFGFTSEMSLDESTKLSLVYSTCEEYSVSANCHATKTPLEPRRIYSLIYV
ncbi:hypothetical protein PPL_06755 [Heterostelium album PN500]|uniref:Uncharacterized protein n=1 Tax=Heterostelium pallidum (strain ATCC 26659 / Pp 5 / PN500) TaxID=670386 RepID=D3BFM0_HETP5|nr:hypothetical protein PPL_06755 [Heterostelium album PN500]EFA79934.1 hypothetical protein PPL_06755 [Heterostelium album PN500]|eukprot:XP_020432054.1 hypothetical protein PPL_06755 [Heterostelium album PN500]